MRCRPINQSKCSQDLLPITVSNLYPILLCNLIDDIQNIFSMIYRVFPHSIHIFIKSTNSFAVLYPCLQQQLLHTILKPSIVIFGRSQHFVSVLFTWYNISSQNGHCTCFFSFNNYVCIFSQSMYIYYYRKSFVWF